MACPTPAALPTVYQALREHGFAVVQDLFPPALVEALADEARALVRDGALRPAAVGPSGGEQHLPALRGDAIRWLEPRGDDGVVDRFLAACDELRLQCNRALLLGMETMEAHFAHYPPGAVYARHRDRFQADDSRVLSLSCYLNRDWRPDHGGALRLHLAGGARDILPVLGTSVLFLSEDVEHEVLCATRARLSIAGWFRRRPVGNPLPL